VKYTGRKGWIASDRDCWSLDCALEPIIAAGLRKFISVDKQGVPGVLVDKCIDKDFKGDEQAYEDYLAGCGDKWNEILDNMLYAFEDNTPKLDKWVDYSMIDRSKGLEEWKELDYSKYRLVEKLHEKRKQEGLDLFAKYFTCLWW